MLMRHLTAALKREGPSNSAGALFALSPRRISSRYNGVG